MAIDINFTNIREYNGSKQNGFEEFVCQIAHIEKPEGAKMFIRKEGSGGDAGVECFWILNNGKEYAWQAKYFLNSLSSSEWSQINKSVETALEKHPNLQKYYICLPRDRTDSRKQVNGVQVTTALDSWNYYVEKWTSLAIDKGMEVEFIYWGQHELTGFIQKDDPHYIGKILYWFDIAVLSLDSLSKLAFDSRVCLGERFTEENHVELPIADSFSCIGRENSFKEDIYNFLSKVNDLDSKILKIIKNKLLLTKSAPCCQLKSEFKSYKEHTFRFEHDLDILFKDIESLKCEVISINDICNELQQYIYKEFSTTDSKDKKEFNELNSLIIKTISELSDLEDFFNNIKLKAGKERVLLITGDAGTGKSHLLCDISLKRLSESYPTVFLLGQHYPGGNPIRFIAEKTNLSRYSDTEVLGALDSLGEMYNCCTLIVIDAINEGRYRHDWQDNLKMFLQQCQYYKNIGVVISCRSTYIDFIIPKDLVKKVPRIEHKGFRGYERRATLQYIGKIGIDLLSVPFLTPEFSNPLFLKTACQAIKEMGLHEFPKGILGFNKVFEFYIDGIEEIVVRKKQTYRKKIVKQVVNDFTSYLFPNNLWGIKYNEAEKIINKYDNEKQENGSLLDILINEGLFSLDIINTNDVKNVEVIRFTYERFSDYAIADFIIKDCKDIEELRTQFLPGGSVSTLLNGGKYKYSGIFEALGILIPEKFGIEFVELVQFDEDKREWEEQWYIETTFEKGILTRTGLSITDKSLDLLNKLRDYSYHSTSMDIVLSLSTEPDHPWNAMFLDENLKAKPLPERDLFWSTYVAVNDYNEDEDSNESPIRTILNWVLNGNIKNAEKERLRLCAIVLLWMTTTSN